VKPKRRARTRASHPQVTVLDDDLLDLARALDENRCESSLDGWLSVPWRNGRNAIVLAERISALLGEPDDDDGWWLAEQLKRPRGGVDVYHEAQERSFATKSLVIKAGLRCMQLWISNSDGGGEIYNVVLRRALIGVDERRIAELVEGIRREDALGDEPIGPRRERARAAFRIAWRRGLYAAAYALGKP